MSEARLYERHHGSQLYDIPRLLSCRQWHDEHEQGSRRFELHTLVVKNNPAIAGLKISGWDGGIRTPE